MMYTIEELIAMVEKVYMQHIETLAREHFDEEFRNNNFLSDWQKDVLFQVCMKTSKREMEDEFDIFRNMMLAKLKESLPGISEDSKVISEVEALTILMSLDASLYESLRKVDV